MEQVILKKCEDPLYSVQFISLRRSGFTVQFGVISSFFPRVLVWMMMSAHGLFSPQKLIWVHIKDLAVLLKTSGDWSLSHFFIVVAVLDCLFFGEWTSEEVRSLHLPRHCKWTTFGIDIGHVASVSFKYGALNHQSRFHLARESCLPLSESPSDYTCASHSLWHAL